MSKNQCVKPGPAKLWAWWNAKHKTYHHLYPRRFCVVICSPDGFKGATKRGEGKIVRVTVCPAGRKKK